MLGHGRDAEGAGGSEMPGGELYSRSMPGGGYVRVELLVSERTNVHGERRRGRVVIEPRGASPRRADDLPLVVEEVEGDESAVVAELFRIARDNAAIARRVLSRRSQARRAD